MNVSLTVSMVDGKSKTPYAQIFESESMRNIVASGSKTMFQYPLDEKRLATFTVDETFASVEALLASVPAGGLRAIWGRFDATAGKAIGTHYLVDPITGLDIEIPEKAVIHDGLAHITTTFTSSTDAATIALGLPTDSAAGLKAAIAISNGANAWDAGKTALIPVGSAATAVGPLTATRKVQVVVAVENLTAGVMDVCIIYSVKP